MRETNEGDGSRRKRRRAEHPQESAEGSGPLDRTRAEAPDRLSEDDRQILRAVDPTDLPPEIVESRATGIRAVELAERSDPPRNADGSEKPVHHAFERHADQSDEDLRKRLTNEDGVKHATAFRSDAAMVMVEGKARILDERVARILATEFSDRPDETRIDTTIAALKLLGPNWRDHVHGMSGSATEAHSTDFPEDTKIFVSWQLDSRNRWVLYTCYPHGRR